MLINREFNKPYMQDNSRGKQTNTAQTNKQVSEIHNFTYNCPSEGKKEVFCWLAGPWSPKKILPESSSLKQREKEFWTKPAFARRLGTEISPGPKPKRPSGATPFR